MRTRSLLSKALIGLLVIVLLAGAGGAYYFKSYLPDAVAPRSFPLVEGELQLAGLESAVDVYRDQMGIPHIYAASLHDLFFAQGYVHAQDRFWQMDTWRHIGSGQLSAMFGAGQVETDAFLRTLGWRVTAQAEWESMGADSKAILQAYTDGVNAYLEDHDGDALSLEYAILKLLSPDYQIAPWEPVNSLTWGKAMAWDLRGNMGDEIERAILLKTLTPEQVAELFPPYPAENPIIVNASGAAPSSDVSPNPGAQAASTGVLQAAQDNVALVDGWLGELGDGVGSNSWAVSGELTSTGLPLIADDPHLGIQMPSIWYQVSLHCTPRSDACPYEVAGFSFAGVPGVVIGHNDRIAWAFTNAGPDVMDLFIERVNPDNPNQYEVNGSWVDFETHTESIQVVGGDPVELTVRRTRHGPVISDSYGPLKNENTENDREFVPFKDQAGIDLPADYVIALQWTALTPSTPFEAIWGFNQAANWEEFREAASAFHVPAQNLLYADTDGNIGYQMPGDIPIRAGGDGRFPVPGWNDDYEWTGFIPFDALPSELNPPQGYIVTANNQIAPTGYPYLITEDWNYGFRARRIVDMLAAAPGKIDAAYIQSMQNDALSPNVRVLVPLLMDVDLGDSDLAELRGELATWDGQESVDSRAAAIFEAFFRHLLLDTFSDDLPKDYVPEGESRYVQVVHTIIQDPNSFWWDDKSTAGSVETREDIFVRAFGEGVQELRDLLGRDTADWTWGALHTATFRNGTLGESGVGPIEALFDRGPFSTGGGSQIVNATSWNATEGFAIQDIPSMRMIVDLSDLNASLTVQSTGQSGHAYHPHYVDMAPLWANKQYYPMWWNEADVIADQEAHLRLVP